MKTASLTLARRDRDALDAQPDAREPRGQPAPSARCPACGRTAAVEEWDAWTPDAGWRRVRAVRCRAPKGPAPGIPRTVATRANACGAVTVESTEAMPAREPVHLAPPTARLEPAGPGARARRRTR